MKSEEIYFDNAATTKVDEKVLKEMMPYFYEKFGNASSQHIKGTEAKEALENSRKKIADKLNAKPSEIFFTSGGTEGNNFVLKGLWFHQTENKTGKNHIITTRIEHDSILKVCEWLEKQGCKITYLDVDSNGFINLEELKKAITKNTFLVSVIHANNEIGTIQEIEDVGKICKSSKVFFHTDACQSFMKILLDTKKLDVDFITLNAHKIHGPKGVGALYIKEGLEKKIVPLFHGGGHEKGLRSGTENIPGIVGFAKSVELINKKDVEKITKLRDKLIFELTRNKNVKLNGPRGKNRLCNNVNVLVKGIDGEALGGFLESYGIYTSTGSACLSNSSGESHVLKALGLSKKDSQSALRITLSKYSTDDEVDYFLNKFKETVKKVGGFS